MLSEGIITDCRETVVEPSVTQYRQQYQAWGLAVLLHLIAGAIFYNMDISHASKTPVTDISIPPRKIIQVQLMSMSPAISQKKTVPVTQQSPESPVPVKAESQPQSAKLHVSAEKTKNRTKDKPLLKKQSLVKRKQVGQIQQNNPLPLTTQKDATPTSTSATHSSSQNQTSKENKTPETPARLDTSYLSNPAPEYPANARESEQEGTVLLQVKVSATGSVLQINVHRSSGYSALDQAAINAVRYWKFAPASTGNVTQEDNVIIPVSFSLEDT